MANRRTLVDICNTSWEVREVSSHQIKKLYDGEIEVCGFVDFDQEVIYINRNMNLYRKAVTVVHEFLHVIYDHVGARMPIDDEEKVISQLEHSVYELIENFPDKYKRGNDDE